MPAVSGYSGSIPLASASAGAGSNVQIVTQAGSPGGLPVIQAHRAANAQSNQESLFVTFTFASNVTMNGFPGFSFALPLGTSTNGTFSLWFFDPTKASLGWQVIAGPVNGANPVTFAPGSTQVSFSANVAYQFALVFAPAATPPPSPTPTPTPAGVPALTTAIFSLGAGFTLPVSIVVGNDNNLWATVSTLYASGNGYIAKVSTSGTYTAYTLPSSVRQPAYITRGPDQALWFTESANMIGRIDTAGNLTEYPAYASGPIVTGTDGNLWFPYNAGVYGFSPTSHTIIGSVTLPTSTGVNQLLSDPVSGQILVETSNQNSSADTIYAFTPGSAPTATPVKTSLNIVPGSLALGGSSIYALSVPDFNTGVESLMTLAQSNYSQTSTLALPGLPSSPLVVMPNGDIIFGISCFGPNNCPRAFDVSQYTSSGVEIGFGPRNQGHQLDEVTGFSYAVLGPDGNAWYVYYDGGPGYLGGVLERVTPNAH